MPSKIFKRPSTKERFLAKVDKENGPVDAKHGRCWVWIASKFKTGYGQFKVKEQNLLAHRVSWILFKGEIPNKKFVLHRCDNKFCVNPRHLWLGDTWDNMKDMVNKGRAATGIRNGTHTRPETRHVGDRNCARKNPEIRQGENNGRAILTEKIVLRILERGKIGGKSNSVANMAKEYGVKLDAISRVLLGESWKHIPRITAGVKLGQKWKLTPSLNKLYTEVHSEFTNAEY